MNTSACAEPTNEANQLKRMQCINSTSEKIRPNVVERPNFQAHFHSSSQKFLTYSREIFHCEIFLEDFTRTMFKGKRLAVTL